ncbi:involucrin-like isoform X2 [Dreissena polymorpha]|nr:involucrin-like isoform X2 [Dreissena polymorpha]
MATIDGLFEQIIHSEKAAQHTKNKIQELRQEVFINQEKCCTLEQKNSELQQLLRTKLDELSRHEFTAKLLASREKIYLDQKTELDVEMKSLVEKQRSVAEWFYKERELLCSQISQYSEQFGGWSLNGQEDRLKHYRQQLEEILVEKQSMESEIEKFLMEEVVVTTITEEKEDLKNKHDKEQEVITALHSELNNETEKTACLENQCQALSEQTQNNPEYISLVKELEECKQQSALLDEEHTRLQDELNNLHQQLWQQQLQQQQTKKLQQLRDNVLVTPYSEAGQQESSTSESQKPVLVESNTDDYSCEKMEDLFSDSDDLDLETDKGQGETDRGQGDSKLKGQSDFQTASDVMQADISAELSMNNSSVIGKYKQQDDITQSGEWKHMPSSQLLSLPLTSKKIFRSCSKN